MNQLSDSIEKFTVIYYLRKLSLLSPLNFRLMQQILNYILFLILFISVKTTSQVYTLLDFGSNEFSTNGNWNNIIVNNLNQIGLDLNLIDFDGKYTGETLVIDDSFDLVNNSGTINPVSSLPFYQTATSDNFFGETNSFNGNINPTGGFTLNNLDPTKYYSFSIFSSRMGVSDNRETLYTAVGQNTVFDTLNPSNNTSETATIFNVLPTANGTINFTATVGLNNNNSFGFYYLGAIKMVSTVMQINDINASYLSLIYPNGSEVWEQGKTVSITWQSFDVNNVNIEYSTNNGNSWSLIATVSSPIKSYEWIIPSSVSDECLVRVSSNGLTDTSSSTFSIIENEGVAYKILILGSSTAQGTGPTYSEDNAWVSRYTYFLKQTDTRFEVKNLAVGGFTTYNILPNGSAIPSGVSHAVDIEHNITKALTLNPDGILINLPSNDAAYNYPSTDQIANYHIIRNIALTQNIPVWISSPQPKNFGTNTIGLNIQLEMLTQTTLEFGEFAFDFWSDLGISSNNGIKPEYNTDGTHMNDTGHRILFDRVKNKGIHTVIKNSVDQSLATESLSNTFNDILIYPNPFNEAIRIYSENDNNPLKNITIFDLNGQLIFNSKTNTNEITIKPFKDKQKIAKGAYYIKITTVNNTITKKIIFN